MNVLTAKVEYRAGDSAQVRQGRAGKLLFSPHRLFRYDHAPEELRCLDQIADYVLSRPGGLALYGPGEFLDYLLQHAHRVRERACCIVDDDEARRGSSLHNLPVVGPADLPEEVATVFLCQTRTAARLRMAKRIRRGVEVICPGVLQHLNWRDIPDRAWAPDSGSIYPLDLPEIAVEPGLDMLLMDLPSRNLSMMPNGLGYVHKALKQTGIKFQTLDGDIILYHRYHTYRLLDTDGHIRLPGGKEMPADPWAAEDMSLWDSPEMLDFFREDLDEIVRAVVRARPKILGLSIQQCNLLFCREVARRAKQALPELVIIAGGYSCRHVGVGRRVFPECDYMAIGEADLTIGPMVTRLARGERPADTPGFISVHDSAGWTYQPAPLPQDLDALGQPDYDWYDVSLYRNHHHYQLTPVIASRGCHWGRCRFCGEALPWRTRSAGNFVDELESMADKGCYQFVFSESDLNGDPELVKDICREVIRRNLPVIFGGQLRIDRRNTPEFFRLLRQAGFVSLRFGVDGWSQHALKLQNKGYNVELIRQNLKDCHEAGIYVEVNAVVGCPGETEQDVQESIDLMLATRKHVGRLANINVLQLLRGSIYWREPEKHNIRFRQDKEKLYGECFAGLPEDVWYSEEPHIDHVIRRQRCERILRALQAAQFDFGAGASPKVEALKSDGQAAAGNQQAGDAPAPTDAAGESAAQLAGGSPTAPPAVAGPDQAPAPLTSRMFKYRGGFYLLSEDGVELPVPRSERPAFRRRLLGALRRRDKWGVYARRILYGGIRALRSRLSPAPRPAAPAGVIDPSTDLGDYGLLALQHELLPNLFNMIKEGFRGYSLMRYQSEYFAVKLGYPFEIDKARQGGYPPGVCLRAGTVKGLVRAILTDQAGVLA